MISTAFTNWNRTFRPSSLLSSTPKAMKKTFMPGTDAHPTLADTGTGTDCELAAANA